jgi:hypothetical protein
MKLFASSNAYPLSAHFAPPYNGALAEFGLAELRIIFL